MTIREAENQIRGQDYETAFVWNSEGLLVLRKDGGKSQVEFSDEEVIRMKGAAVTHNHPHGLTFTSADPRSFGNSFSENDIRLACLAEVAEIRVVTPKLRFSMKPPVSGWSLALWEDTIEPCYSKHYGEVWEELMTAFSSGQITSAEADANIMHETWNRVAKELGLVYDRQED